MLINPDNNVPEYEPRGRLILERTAPHRITAYFVSEATELDPQESQVQRVKLLVVDGHKKQVTIHPINTNLNGSYLEPKYDKIRQITIANFQPLEEEPIEQWEMNDDDIAYILEKFPPVFVKDYEYGLGLRREYRPIIKAIETLSNCSEVVITEEGVTRLSPDGKTFYITKDHFRRMRLDIDRIQRLSRIASIEVKTTTVHNVLAEQLGMPKLEPNVGRHPLRKLFTDAAQGKTNLSKKDQNDIIGAISSNAINIAKDQPEKLAKLRTDIELVTLAELIKQFEEMMKKPLPERQWQSFFNKNPFILGLAFGNPVIKIGEQVFVGGRTISGAGDKITDFLVKNSLTDNAALVEIKTPRTILLNKRPVREGVYTPSADLSSAINQVLDQKYHLQRNIAQLKADSNTDNFESYSVRCYLIIGTLPSDVNSLKSFELFRGNSKDVEIVTFDELLENLKHLHDFLSNDKEKYLAAKSNPQKPSQKLKDETNSTIENKELYNAQES